MSTDAQNAEQKSDFHIRWMIKRDMPEVLAIEAECFEFPWSEEDFIRCLQQRHCIGTVADFNDKIIGFMIYEILRTGIRILNFVIDSAFRRRGFGTKMVERLADRLSAQHRNQITLEIRETNFVGCIFFQSNGFRVVEIQLNGWKETPRERIFLMRKMAQPPRLVEEPESYKPSTPK